MNIRGSIHCLFVVILAIFLFGCAAKAPLNDPPGFCPQQIDAAMVQPKVDHFVIVMDASSSMAKPYGARTRFDLGKSILKGMNATLPELGQMAALRSFGHHPRVSDSDTARFYGMAAYHNGAFADQAVLISRPGGKGSLANALAEALRNDLGGMPKGRGAIVVITDGMGLDEAGMGEVRAMKERLGDLTCIYPIQVGFDRVAAQRLAELADLGGCGQLVNAGDLTSGRAMAAYVEKVFLEPKVLAPIAAVKDSDTDGVSDPLDQCPETPAGAVVDEAGCWAMDHVLFDFDQAVVKPEAHAVLAKMVEILERNPGQDFSIEGHADNIGPEIYNAGLSLRRAKAVAAYLQARGIALNRLVVKGYGYSRPISTNGTPGGRARNRRVEIHPL